MSLILTPGVFKVIHEKYQDLLKEGLKYNTSSVYVSNTDIKFSNITTDMYFSLSLFYNNGVFDSKHDVVSSRSFCSCMGTTPLLLLSEKI